nr:GNAT family N-acetyltransferase [Kofleriaceae bacterium]
MALDIRDATPADYDAYVGLFPELAVDDPIPSRERWVAELLPRTLVAASDGAVVGYLLLEILADTGYVRNLVTAPAYRRGGVGAALMAAARARFVAGELAEWCLNVKPDNVAAIALYERCGLARSFRSTVVRFPRELALPAPAPDLALAPIAPADDRALEGRFGLLAGQLTNARARSQRRTFALRRGADTVGVCVFSEAHHGAYPLRVASPELGVAFVALLRPLLVAGAPYLQTTADGDEPLVAAYLAAGARRQLEIVHMAGRL